MAAREDILARMAALTPTSTGKELTEVRTLYKVHKKAIADAQTEPGHGLTYLQAFWQEPGFRHYRKLMDAHRDTPHVRGLRNARRRKKYAKDPQDKLEDVRARYYAKKGIKPEDVPPKRSYERRSQ